jgi:hypothetical protein
MIASPCALRLDEISPEIAKFWLIEQNKNILLGDFQALSTRRLRFKNAQPYPNVANIEVRRVVIARA